MGCVDDCCGWSFCEGSRWTLMITRLGNRNGLQTTLLFKRGFFLSPFFSLVFLFSSYLCEKERILFLSLVQDIQLYV